MPYLNKAEDFNHLVLFLDHNTIGLHPVYLSCLRHPLCVGIIRNYWGLCLWLNYSRSRLLRIILIYLNIGLFYTVFRKWYCYLITNIGYIILLLENIIVILAVSFLVSLNLWFYSFWDETDLIFFDR